MLPNRGLEGGWAGLGDLGERLEASLFVFGALGGHQSNPIKKFGGIL